MLALTLNHTSMRAWTESRLGVHFRWSLILKRRVPSAHKIFIMSGLPSLIERILPTTGVLPWLNGLQSISNVRLRASQNLLTVLLKNAWQFDGSFSFRTSFLFMM